MDISARRTERVIWAVALVTAVVQALAHRDGVSHDGIAYLDLADRIAHGDGSGALNRYWSPLYPVLLGVANALTGAGRPNAIAVAHAVNVAVFAVALAAFAMMVRGLRALQERDPDRWLLRASESHGIVALYLLFFAGAMRYSNVTLVTPDLLVLAAALGVGALIVRAAAAPPRAIHHVALGALLCAGYLAKAAMLPLAVPFIAAHALVNPANRLRGSVLTVGTFLLLSAPYVAALSRADGEFTTGRVASIAFARYVGGAALNGEQEAPTRGPVSFEHPMHRLADRPAVYEFAAPVRGTYPPGTDPAYWQRGIQWTFRIDAELRTIVEQLRDYWAWFGVLVIGLVAVAGTTASATAAAPRLAAALWLAGAAPFALYALVFADERYFGGFVVLLGAGVVAWARADEGRGAVVAALLALAALAAARWPVAIPSPRELAFSAVLAVGILAATARGAPRKTPLQFVRILLFCVVCAAPAAGRVARDAELAWRLAHGRDEEPWSAVAAAIREAGATQGAAVASIGASLPAAWAYWAGVHIVAEVPARDAAEFCALDAAAQEPTLGALAAAGAIVAVARSADAAIAGWHRVHGTDYWVHALAPRPDR
jgi:hypothetical protein